MLLNLLTQQPQMLGQARALRLWRLARQSNPLAATPASA